jgi:inorganic pyrophosphatase
MPSHSDEVLFWRNIDALVTGSGIVIDRQKGSTHPRYPEFVYPHDYGYLEGTVSGDGQGIDVWVGSSQGDRATAVICTVDLTKRDAEIKILIDCLPQEIDTIHEFHNAGDQAGALLRRPVAEADKENE